MSAADVHARHDEVALSRLDERPGLRDVFEVERHETRPERRTLYFDAVTGWRFVDLCDMCGGDLGYLEDAPALAALCGSCEDIDDLVAGSSTGSAGAGYQDSLAG